MLCFLFAKCFLPDRHQGSLKEIGFCVLVEGKMYFYEIRQKVFRKNRESKEMRGCNLKDSEFYASVLIFTEFEDN